MEIDFLSEGSPDCPLLRIISDRKDEINTLQSNIMQLSNSQLNEVTITDLPVSNSKLKLVFKLSKADVGVKISNDKKEFIVELSQESWLEFAEKLNPFLKEQKGFTWLYNSVTISIVFTTDGHW